MNDEIKPFIKIPNKFFIMNKTEYGEELDTIFYQIGTEGFTIYCYLLMTKGNQLIAQTNIKRIYTFLNSSKRQKKKIDEQYQQNDNNKKKSLNPKYGLNDYRTIKKYLSVLLKVGLIKDQEHKKEGYLKSRVDDELIISVIDNCDKNGFSGISSELFSDNIKKLGHIGWSIYCLLFQYHNLSFGNQSIEYMGFASCTEETIAKIIHRDRKTISEYINKILEGLVKIQKQDPITRYNAIKDKDEYIFMPNHYIVQAKYDTSNKYYIKYREKTKKTNTKEDKQ